MFSVFTNKSRMISEVMKFSFHHRAFYCYVGMSIWICFLIAVMYKYISVGEEAAVAKKINLNKYLSKSDLKFRRMYMKVCNPPDSIIRGSEGAIDDDAWSLQGVLVLTRHGDRGPLTHLRGGDKLPCNTVPESPLLKSYEEFVQNISGVGRPPWVQSPGPFHNFPTLPVKGGSTTCALGQLTPQGLLQMLRIGSILKDAYARKLDLSDAPATSTAKREIGDVLSFSTRYRRTYQSLLGVLYGLSPETLPARAAAVRETHSVAFCFKDCACDAQHTLLKKINALSKDRLKNHPAVKELVNKISKVMFESQEYSDPDVLKDALLAYMCHDTPLPCTEKPNNHVLGEVKLDQTKILTNTKRLRSEHGRFMRSLLDTDTDNLNIELEYINNQLDSELKARDNIGKYYDSKDKQKALLYIDKQKVPLDFDAQMEREKLMYYQQRYSIYMDSYDNLVVKVNPNPDFNFHNDPRLDGEFEDETYKEPTPEMSEEMCVKKDNIMSLFAYIEWSYRQEMKNIHSKRRGLLLAYGLIHNIVQNVIRMISENKPKLVIYSGHDKTLQALIVALGLNNYYLKGFSASYASRMIFEVYKRKDFKFMKRKAVAQDFYIRVVYNGDDVTSLLSFCHPLNNIVMTVPDPIDDTKLYNAHLCPIENIVRFIHDDYFAVFNVSNFKDACLFYNNAGKNVF